ncbi:MarR family winged helix-turn-helix transcriptional regulator [Streptomyces sp. NPDC020951]|uniref:MarR family winged helix-turn-helix transcriptional regulator n=1 Tax=Streptomyces sp. NPDC020951 TaxID=3365104 RepID=UPI003797DE02
MSDSGWLTADEQQTWQGFIAMQAALVGRLNAHLQKHSKLSSADYSVLVALSEAPGGRAKAVTLSKETGWEKSRLSHHLSRMERRGLLHRQECPEDGRYSDVVLTSAGRSAIEAAAPCHVAHVRKWFIDTMTPEQLTAFGAMCEAVAARVNASADDPCRIGHRSTADMPESKHITTDDTVRHRDIADGGST